MNFAKAVRSLRRQIHLRRPLSARPLTHCPACKKPVRKVISAFNSPTKLKPLSITDAKKAGFTVLKRVNKGDTNSNKSRTRVH